MPVADFSPDQKISRASDVPKLRLEKSQKARIVVLDRAPQFRWQHRLAKIKLGAGGAPAKETKTRRNGEEYEVYAEEFIGIQACGGDPEVLKDRGLDPDGCVICKATKDFPDAFRAPTRRFAMNIFQYSVKPGTSDVAEPFGGQVLVWAFTDRRFTELIDIAAEFDNLQQHDLILGPCTNEVFQNYDILASPKAAWLASDETKEWTKTAFKENGFGEQALLDMCARVTESRYMIEDSETVTKRWEYVAEYETHGGKVSASETVADAVVAEATKDVGDALEDLFSAGETATESTPESTPEPEKEAEPEEKGESIGGLGDLDDLLNG